MYNAEIKNNRVTHQYLYYTFLHINKDNKTIKWSEIFEQNETKKIVKNEMKKWASKHAYLADSDNKIIQFASQVI